MSKYIDCEPLINVFSGGDIVKSMSESIADARFVEALKKAPAADVAEVKHGEWINGKWEDGDYKEQCSRCYEWSGEYYRGFCSSCGAKMDGKAGADND